MYLAVNAFVADLISFSPASGPGDVIRGGVMAVGGDMSQSALLLDDEVLL